MQAAMSGDFTMLEAELAGKDAKGSEAYIKLGQKSYSDLKAKADEKRQKDVAMVNDIMGGAEEWGKVRAWALANADDDEKKEIAAALQAGGLKTRMAAVFLKDAYGRAHNVSDDGEGRAVSTAKGAPSNTDALDPRAYAKAVIEARAKFKGGDFENSSEYKALRARRMAYKG